MASSVSFDQKRWAETIKQPLWYLELVDFLEGAGKQLGSQTNEFLELNRDVRKFFERQLEAGNVNLAKDGSNLDEERRPIDTIVIHHTSGDPGYTLPYMNAVQLLNIYARHYASKRSKQERGLTGQAIWSNHFRNDQPSFLAYHWFMRMDGSVERLLNDDQIGWHAGNWEVNKRSIGICLDNDYDNRDPSPEVLKKLAAHIKHHYPDIKKDGIIGHCEARQGTTCPGTNYLDGWKADLLNYIYDT